MPRKIIIIGNSGAARECYWNLLDVINAGADLTFGGFLAFEGYPGNLLDLDALQLGSDDDYALEDGVELVIGLGGPALRLKVYEKWKARGAKFFNLIHPDVYLQGPVDMGEGNIITGGSSLSCNTRIGHVNFLNGSILFGHDVTVGDANFFGPGTKLLGNVTVGSANSFGTNSVALVKARIGDNNLIAPGSYIYKGCRDNCRLAGNPAVKIGFNDPL